MKTLKLILAATVVAATFTTIAATTAKALVTPHWAGAQPQTVSSTADADQAHDFTVLGYAAKSKAAGPATVSASRTDPNLITCAKRGKGSCAFSGTVAPCCQGAVRCKK